jgi:hypothetical protein
MRKFILLFILALGYAVCYAAPPPDPVIYESAVSYLDDQIQPMLVATPCTPMQDQQPAPLLNSGCVPREIKIPVCLEIKQPPWLTTNFNSFIATNSDIGNLNQLTYEVSKVSIYVRTTTNLLVGLTVVVEIFDVLATAIIATSTPIPSTLLINDKQNII